MVVADPEPQPLVSIESSCLSYNFVYSMVTSPSGPPFGSQSAVHNNTGISDVEKFNYLISLLERSAKDAVSGLALTAAIYQQAIAILKK